MKTHKTISLAMVPGITPGKVVQTVKAARLIKPTLNVWRKNSAKKTPPIYPQ